MPVAALLTYFDVLGRMTTTFFAHRVDAAIERFDYKGIERNYLNWVRFLGLYLVPFQSSSRLHLVGEFVQTRSRLRYKVPVGCRWFDTCRTWPFQVLVCNLASLPSVKR